MTYVMEETAKWFIGSAWNVSLAGAVLVAN
jgi:hypothetical protein